LSKQVLYTVRKIRYNIVVTITERAKKIMLTKEKLKELRKKQNLTQEQVAEAIGVSAQTVSKWERGLLQPDLSVLPRLAALYKTTLDAMFDMEVSWNGARREEFWGQYRSLRDQGDAEGIYRLFLQHTEQRPHDFPIYPDLMRHVVREKMFDDAHVARMVQLAGYAEQNCENKNTVYEILVQMVMICSGSDNPAVRAKAESYWLKLPMLRHSREVYYHLLPGEKNREHMKAHVFLALENAEKSIRQLITPEMDDAEKLYYYRKAAALFEVCLEDGYGGVYEEPLLENYVEIACCYARMEHTASAEEVVQKLLARLEKHIDPDAAKDFAPMISSRVRPLGYTPPESMVLGLLNKMLARPELAGCHAPIADWERRYREQFRQ